VLKEKLAETLEHWANIILKTQEILLSAPTNAITDVSSHEPPIDWEHLHQISENNSEFELELLQIFVEDAQSHIEATTTAINSSDFLRFEQEAHHLKGSSANVGAVGMSLTAQKLEQLARSKERIGTSDLISELEESVSRIQAFLTRKNTDSFC
jgi:HPt (histidine-containing phosphotransfer) domain-containing protein